MPYEPVGVWLIDQWRQIGLNVKQEVLESAQYFGEIRGGNYQVGMHFRCGYIVEPDLALYQFQSREVSHDNYGRYTDRSSTIFTRNRAERSIPRSGSGSSARSRSGYSTTRHTTSRHCSITGSSRTARKCGAGRLRPATTSTSSWTRCGWPNR
jgi:hypothetical protein